MKLDLTGIHVEITEGLTEFVDRKVERLGKFFPEDTIIHVTIATNRDEQKLSIRIEHNSHTYLADVETDDVYHAMDEALEILIGQIRKQKDKMEKARHEGIAQPELESEIDIENILENNDEE